MARRQTVELLGLYAALVTGILAAREFGQPLMLIGTAALLNAYLVAR